MAGQQQHNIVSFTKFLGKWFGVCECDCVSIIILCITIKYTAVCNSTQSVTLTQSCFRMECFFLFSLLKLYLNILQQQQQRNCIINIVEPFETIKPEITSTQKRECLEIITLNCIKWNSNTDCTRADFYQFAYFHVNNFTFRSKCNNSAIRRRHIFVCQIIYDVN